MGTEKVNSTRYYRLQLIRQQYQIGQISETEALTRLASPHPPFMDVTADDSMLLKATEAEIDKVLQQKQ